MLTENDRRLGHRLAGKWLRAAGETNALVLAEHFEKGAADLREEAVAWLSAPRALQGLEGNDLPRRHRARRARHRLRRRG